MGTQTILSGYIELPYDSLEFNEVAFSEYNYADNFPLRDIFSKPLKGYRSLIVSFADSLKANAEEWGQWLRKFEELLSCINALSAKVYFEDDETQNRCCFSYIKSKENWIRWRINSMEKEVHETTLNNE